MATLIPALGACLRRMTPGEKRLAERLEDKSSDSMHSHFTWRLVSPGM